MLGGRERKEKNKRKEKMRKKKWWLRCHDNINGLGFEFI